MSRQQFNELLVRKLARFVKKYPYLRFGQILDSFGFVKRKGIGSWEDEFYMESKELYERVRSHKDL